MLDCTQVGDDHGRTSCSDIDLRTVCLCIGQRADGRLRNLMGIETHQRPVNIKKQCVVIGHNNPAAKLLIFFANFAAP